MVSGCNIGRRKEMYTLNDPRSFLVATVDESELIFAVVSWKVERAWVVAWASRVELRVQVDFRLGVLR